MVCLTINVAATRGNISSNSAYARLLISLLIIIFITAQLFITVLTTFAMIYEYRLIMVVYYLSFKLALNTNWSFFRTTFKTVIIKSTFPKQACCSRLAVCMMMFVTIEQPEFFPSILYL